jgi:hypothetical protein
MGSFSRVAEDNLYLERRTGKEQRRAGGKIIGLPGTWPGACNRKRHGILNLKGARRQVLK